VPAQALTLLNNPFVLQQADLWGKNISGENGLSTKDRIGTMYVAAFARPPSPEELADAQAFIEEQGRAYNGVHDNRAWADLCHVLFNVKEFIFVP
jgi:hypothetical protein